MRQQPKCSGRQKSPSTVLTEKPLPFLSPELYIASKAKPTYRCGNTYGVEVDEIYTTNIFLDTGAGVNLMNSSLVRSS